MMAKSFGSYKIGDRVRFLDDEVYISGVIEQLTEHQVVIKPDEAGTKFFDGYRVCLSRNELAVRLKNVSTYTDMVEHADGSISL